MPAPYLDKCCGCIDLKTGCLIIGYLQLVGEILIGAYVLLLVVGGGLGLASGEWERQILGALSLTMGVFRFLLLALLLTFTITLLVGLHKNKRGHVKAYLIYAAIFLVLYTILVFGKISLVVIVLTKTNIIIPGILGHIIFEVFIYLVVMTIAVHFLRVVHSYYHKMDDANQGAIYNTA